MFSAATQNEKIPFTTFEGDLHCRNATVVALVAARVSLVQDDLQRIFFRGVSEDIVRL